MPIVVARTFVVTAPADVVLDYLRDFGNTQQWDPATRRTTRLGDGPIVVGSSWRHEARVLGVRAELTYTLAAAADDRRGFVGRSEGATSTGTVTVRPVEDGTEVTYHVDLEMHGLAKLATPVLRAEAEKLATETALRLAGVLNRLTSPA
jgi:carbon monoxide dehydrogenase subunit G